MVHNLTSTNDSLRESLNKSEFERKQFESSIDKTAGEKVHLANLINY